MSVDSQSAELVELLGQYGDRILRRLDPYESRRLDPDAPAPADLLDQLAAPARFDPSLFRRAV